MSPVDPYRAGEPPAPLPRDRIVAGPDVEAIRQEAARYERDRIAGWLEKRAKKLDVLRSLEATYGAKALRFAAASIRNGDEP